MSQVARSLLRKPIEVSDALRVVFTAVRNLPARSIPKKQKECPPPKRKPAALDAGAKDKIKKAERNTNAQRDDVVKVKRTKSPSAKKVRLGRPRGVQKRPEVVNEQLMDDVLEYLAPNLEQFKGRTILDLYPGSCLWSRKVHEYLKPKCHLLIEPEAQYQDYIDELVNSPGSTYKHVALPGAIDQLFAETYDHIFSDEGPLPRPQPATESPATLETDSSLLVIGSLTRRSDLRYHGRSFSGSLASAYHLSWGALLNDYMHRQGPVRMLFWTPETDRAQFLPEWCLYRNATEAAMGLAMQVQTVVAVDQVISRKNDNEWSARSRWSGLQATREAKVQEKMIQNGMRVPKNRQTFHFLVQKINPGMNPRPIDESPYRVRYKTRKQVEKALEDLVHHWNTRASTTRPAGRGQEDRWRFNRLRPEEIYQYLEYPSLADAMLENPCKSVKAAARTRSRAQEIIYAGTVPPSEIGHLGRQENNELRTEITGTDLRIAFYADAALRGINLEMHCAILEDRGVDVADLKKRVMEFSDCVVDHVNSKRQVYEIDFVRLVDDWTSFFAPSPLLMLDRRQYEPLQASPSDFSPQTNLALLDFVPTNRDLAVPGLVDRRKAAHACRSIIRFLYAFKSQSVTAVLERLAPNAATDLISLTPAITDPRKGGRLDAKHVKVRQLTDEMLEGLVKAWFEWPFKPEGWELEVELTDTSYVNAPSRGPMTPEAVTADDEGEI